MSRLGIALLAPALFAATAIPASNASVLVVFESGVDAYAQVVSGVSAALPGGTFRVLDAAGQNFERDFSSALEGNEARVLIAVGSRAMAAARAHRVSLPMVASMVLPEADPQPGILRIDLKVPPAAQLAALRALWPGRQRAAIIRNPAHSQFAAGALEACARRQGFSLLVVDCDGPSHLMKAMAELKGKVDFVLCTPDPELYNAVTIKPLVLASLDERLPLVGFSAAFVRAGAAAGIFPDYAEIGRQAAEMALRVLRGEDRGLESQCPRRIQVAVNQRVVRLLGLESHPEAVSAEVYR
jgi:ABC-type uncharacterized transport system substrate-binding protein